MSKKTVERPRVALVTVAQRQEVIATFAQRLRQARLKAGMNRAELGRRVGVSRDTASKYESGYYLPNRDNLDAIAKALHVDANWLLPNAVKSEDSAGMDDSQLEFKIDASNPARAWLRVNRDMPTETALRIVAILGEIDAPRKN